MDLSDYEVPRVLVTCRIDKFQIQFDREEFCLETGLKFGVENWIDYNDEAEPIPFRCRVFSSSLDGQPIRGKHVEALINSKVFKKLDDNDAVSLCCVGILQLVLLGPEDRRHVPNWILRRWPTLYATQPTDKVDKKSYSLTGFLWAFKTWILESFLAAMNDYYTCYRRLPRIVAWSSKNKFYLRMLKPFLHGQLPVERLVPDEIEARSFMEDTRVGPVSQANKEPIIVDQHYGISDLSGFQSYQGVSSPFQTLANSSPFFNMATPSNLQTPIQSNWQTPSNWQTLNPSYLGTPNSQPPISSHPGTSVYANKRWGSSLGDWSNKLGLDSIIYVIDSMDVRVDPPPS
ncbi:hypothetical protein Tco_0723563 [Tanacetum coccineum]